MSKWPVIFTSVFMTLLIGGSFLLHQLAKPLPSLAFSLTDSSGRHVTSEKYKDKPALIFFGLTQCSSMCPVTLARLVEVTDQLAKQKEDTRIIFVTIDPAHDTPAALQSYLSNFSPAIIGLTGSKNELEPLYQAFRVYPRRGDKTTDHSGFVFVVDKTGSIRTYFSGQTSAATMEKLTAAALGFHEG